MGAMVARVDIERSRPTDAIMNLLLRLIVAATSHISDTSLA
jgi:hypothetical protein